MKMLAFAFVSDIFRIGVKISRWRKNSLGGVKIHQVGKSDTVNVLRPTLHMYNSIFVY